MRLPMGPSRVAEVVRLPLGPGPEVSPLPLQPSAQAPKSHDFGYNLGPSRVAEVVRLPMGPRSEGSPLPLQPSAPAPKSHDFGYNPRPKPCSGSRETSDGPKLRSLSSSTTTLGPSP